MINYINVVYFNKQMINDLSQDYLIFLVDLVVTIISY